MFGLQSQVSWVGLRSSPQETCDVSITAGDAATAWQEPARSSDAGPVSAPRSSQAEELIATATTTFGFPVCSSYLMQRILHKLSACCQAVRLETLYAKPYQLLSFRQEPPPALHVDSEEGSHCVTWWYLGQHAWRAERLHSRTPDATPGRPQTFLYCSGSNRDPGGIGQAYELFDIP